MMKCELPLDAACDEGIDELLLEEGKCNQNRQHDDERCSHEQSPLCTAFGLLRIDREADGQCAGFCRFRDQHRPKELIPVVGYADDAISED